MRTWKISVLFALAGHKENRKTCATRKFKVRTKRVRPWTTAQENLSRGCSVVHQVTLANANARIISSLVPLNKPPLPLGRVCCQLNWEEKV